MEDSLAHSCAVHLDATGGRGPDRAAAFHALRGASVCVAGHRSRHHDLLVRRVHRRGRLRLGHRRIFLFQQHMRLPQGDRCLWRL